MDPSLAMVEEARFPDHVHHDDVHYAENDDGMNDDEGVLNRPCPDQGRFDTCLRLDNCSIIATFSQINSTISTHFWKYFQLAGP